MKTLPLLLLTASLTASCILVVDAGSDSSDRMLSASASPAHTNPAHAPLHAEAPRLMADVTWLADDARYGRRSGTPGEDAARDFLVARLKALGLKPAGESGYTQPFTVPLPARDGGGSRLVAGAVGELTFQDAHPLFCSSGGEVAGDLAWVGFGIVDPEAGRDDYQDLDVAGKIVLVARGAPPFPQPEPDEDAPAPGSYGGPRTSFGSAASIFTKVMNAKHHGAVAVILAQDPAKANEPLLGFDAAQEAQAGIPALMISVANAETLLDGGYASDLERTKGTGSLAAKPEGGASVLADVERESGTADNVLGLLPGTDHLRAVVIGAHYDHLGLGGTGSLSSKSIGQIHNGADDNASGTAAVLELARLLTAEARRGNPPACDVVFALWSGEELGLLGSDHWCDNPTLPGGLGSVAANLNMDMVGRAESGRLQVMGAGSSKPIARWLEEAAARSGLDPVVSLSGHGIGGSDHQSFLMRGVPAVHLFTGVHSDYHKPSDDSVRFEADAAAQVVEYGRFIVAMMCDTLDLPFEKMQLAEEDDRPSKERSWSAWFGSIPDYTSESGGLLITGVQEGSPAERAGLLGGDRITAAGGVEIDTIHDFVYCLQLHKPGDVINVTYQRAGKEEAVMLTLGSRELE